MAAHRQGPCGGLRQRGYHSDDHVGPLVKRACARVAGAVLTADWLIGLLPQRCPDESAGEHSQVPPRPAVTGHGCATSSYVPAMGQWLCLVTLNLLLGGPSVHAKPHCMPRSSQQWLASHVPKGPYCGTSAIKAPQRLLHTAQHCLPAHLERMSS